MRRIGSKTRGRRRGYAVHARPPRRAPRILAALAGVLLAATLGGYAGVAAGSWVDARITRADWLSTTLVVGAPPPAKPPICTIGPLRQILITGSSTIGYWSDSAQALAPMVSENIGVGGTTMVDQLDLAKNVIPEKRPDVILLYAGANDIFRGQSAEDVFAELSDFVTEVNRVLPRTVIYYISINPTPAGARVRRGYDEMNRLVADAVVADPGGPLRYIDTAAVITRPDGTVDPSRYRPDRTHLNDAGYAVFSAAIRTRLLAEGYQYRPCRAAD